MARRSVSFVDDDALCIYHDGAVMDVVHANAGEIWYQANDMSIIKRKAFELINGGDYYSLGVMLTNTYGRNDQATVDAITAWCMSCAGRRGLERFLNKDYFNRRSDLRRRVITSVLRAQAKMRKEGMKDAEYVSQVLSRLSETFSKDSNHIARALGCGDERAVYPERRSTEPT